MVAWNRKKLALAAAAALAVLGGCLKAGDGEGLSPTGTRLSFCEMNPTHVNCVVVVDTCIANPTGPTCPDRCKAVPPPADCSTDVCLTNPLDPSCPPPKTKFSEIFPILKQQCHLCHLPGLPGVLTGKLDLQEDSAYTTLVNRLVTDQVRAPGYFRVKPGSSDSSVFYIKISQTAPKLPNGKTYYTPMPQTGAPVSASNLALIKKWINDGALK